MATQRVVMTVGGPVAPDALGIVTMREHPWIDATPLLDRPDELRALANRGAVLGFDLLKQVVPPLRDAGATYDEVGAMLVRLPARLLAVPT